MTRILVIDDETVIRGLMAEILESADYEVVCAETAERALALLEEIDVSLVVSDVVMPGLSGIELLDAVRARRASLPVVLVTGAGTYDTLSRALTRGAAGLITKPFAHDDLLTAVADALDRAARTEADLRERLLAPTLASALVEELTRCRGTQWDAQVVDLALALTESGELELGPDGPRLQERTEVQTRAGVVPILLAEDDDDHAVLVTEALESGIRGASVSRARTVQTAGDLMRGSTWSLAVIDNQLPDGSGVQVLDALRATQPQVPARTATSRSPWAPMSCTRSSRGSPRTGLTSTRRRRSPTR